MKLSCVATTAIAITILSATPVLSQEANYGYNVIPRIPTNCSDIRIFSARGSNEPYPGRAGAMLAVMCQMFESADGDLSCDYEDITFPANQTSSGVYCQSAHTGTVNGRAQMADYIERCPDSRLVLLGYSQGAGIVTDILGGGGGDLFGCHQEENPSMPRKTAPGSSVVAAVTFGSTRFTANQSYNIGPGSTFNGILPSAGKKLADLNAYEDILASWCNAGDPICAIGSLPVNVTAHWSYYDEYTYEASRWVVRTALGYTDDQLNRAFANAGNDTFISSDSSSSSSSTQSADGSSSSTSSSSSSSSSGSSSSTTESGGSSSSSSSSSTSADAEATTTSSAGLSLINTRPGFGFGLPLLLILLLLLLATVGGF